MSALEYATSTLTLPAWAVAGAAALFIVIAVLSLSRAGASVAGAILRVAVVIAICGAAFVLLQQNALSARVAERRALDQRAAELAARVVAPGSPLACLDAVAGDAVETACEKAVFASPASVAAAVSYVTARLALLADAVDYARRSGGGYESPLATLRMSIETDRYGIVAHVLSVRDSCTPLLCDSYVLFKDPDRVQANLRDRPFDRYVERYAAEWTRAPTSGTPLAEAPPTYTTASVPPTGPAAPAAATGVPVPSKYDFPSAASIPAVSIMTPEPSAPAETKPAPLAAPAAASAPKRAHPAPRAAAHHAPPPPQPIGPPPSAQTAPTAANAPALH